MKKKQLTSHFIKNPKRLTDEQVAAKKRAYVPENVRLGMEPPPPVEVVPTDFAFSKKKRPFVTSSRGPIQNPSLPVGKVFIKAESQRQPPQQYPVTSGYSHEHTWYPTDEDDMEEFETFTHEEISEEDVPIPGHQIEVEEDHREVQMNPVSVHNLPTGNFCIFLNDSLIYAHDSIEKIEAMIEFILFDETSPFQVEQAEELVVLERLPIRIGVMVTKR